MSLNQVPAEHQAQSRPPLLSTPAGGHGGTVGGLGGIPRLLWRVVAEGRGCKGPYFPRSW